MGFTLNWFCTIESITKTQIQCRTPVIDTKYEVGSALNVVVSTRLVVLNKCTGSCSFTYIDAASSPALAAISTSSVTVAGSNTKSLTLTGTNLIDSNSFAEVAVTHTISKVVTVFSSTSASATSVVFEVPTSLIAGTYNVVVRNLIGGSNALSLSVKINPGSASWNTGGSVAGGIVSLFNGGGFPASIDGKVFSLTLTANGMNYPTNIISCCSSNTVEFEIPAAVSGTLFSIILRGPGNWVNKTYTTSTSLTPTASLPTANLTSGSNSVVLNATNAVSATITSLLLVPTISTASSITIDVATLTLAGSGIGATTTFTATLNAGSYKIKANTANGYIDIAETLNVGFPADGLSLIHI